MVSNSASDDGSTEVSSSLGLFCLVPLIILELGQTEISLAVDKKENKCKKWKDYTHTKLLLQLLHSLNLMHSPLLLHSPLNLLHSPLHLLLPIVPLLQMMHQLDWYNA